MKGTLVDLIGLSKRDTQTGDTLLLGPGDVSLTYQKTNLGALRLATMLVGLGMEPGDHVFVDLPNGPGFVIALFGVLRASGVAVLGENGITSGLQVPAGRWWIGQAGADETDRGGGSSSAAEPTLRIERLFDGCRRIFRPLSQTAWDGSALAEVSLPLQRPEDAALILYTSGSDGVPKGVIKTHANLLVEVDFLADMFGTGPRRFLSMLPWSYIYGLIHHLLIPLRLGGTVCTLLRYTPRSILDSIRTHRIDVLVTVPSILRAISQLPDLPHRLGLQWAATSGAPVDPATLHRLDQAGLRLIELYGSTETGGITINLNKADGSSSAGRILPHVELKVDTKGATGKASTTGAVLVRGPSVSRFCYRGDQLIPAVDAAGWLRLEDHGSLDSAGGFRLICRASRIIKFDGRRVSLDEIEQTLLRLPGTEDVAVFASADEIHGEVPVVQVVLAPKSRWSEKSLLSECRKLFPSYKRPRSVRVVERIQRKGRGKVASASATGQASGK